MTIRQSAIGSRQSIAWHGWRLSVPREWNPVRVEGGWSSGFVLLADLHRPRLGLRWGVVKERRFDACDWARRTIRDEVGKLAAREAKALRLEDENFEGSTLYVDPDAPGRDVWVGYSRASARGVELIYHAQRRDDVLAERVVPTLSDAAPGEPTPWAIFDLSCVAPAGMRLKSHQLNAGDVRLSFADRGRLAGVRQVAVARLALARMPLEAWLATELRSKSLHFRGVGNPDEIAHEAVDGRSLVGFCRSMRRRRRFCFMRGLPIELFVGALHDADRDRLLIVHASSRELFREVARSVGCRA